MLQLGRGATTSATILRRLVEHAVRAQRLRASSAASSGCGATRSRCFPAYEERAVRIELFGDEVERISSVDPLTGEIVEELDDARRSSRRRTTSPARSGMRAGDRGHRGRARGAAGRARGAAASCSRRSGCACAPSYDLEMLREVGYCTGIENYSLHLDGRQRRRAAVHPARLLPRRLARRRSTSRTSTVPQLHGQYEGDRSRKETLVEHGFRLPSALDNRPLRFEEFIERVNQVVFMSATPGAYELRDRRRRSSSRSCARPASSTPRSS